MERVGLLESLDPTAPAATQGSSPQYIERCLWIEAVTSSGTDADSGFQGGPWGLRVAGREIATKLGLLPSSHNHHCVCGF